MARKFLAVQGQGLESDHLVLGLEVGRVEGEGHIDGAVGVLGNELGLGGDGVAVGIEELLLGDLAVLVGDLLVEGAGDLVGLAGSDVLVLHGIDDSNIALTDEVLVRIQAVHGSGGKRGLRDGDGLGLVLDIGMARKFLAVQGQGLESDHLVLGLEVGRVEGEGHIDGAVGVLGNELGLGGDGVAVGIEELLLGDLAVLVGDLLVEGAGNLVGLAGCHVHVMDGIDDGGIILTDEVLITIKGIRCGSGELGLRDDDSLAGIIHVGMGSNLIVVVGQGLEGNERGAFLERTAIEVEGHIDVSVGVLCGKVCFRSDGGTVLVFEYLLRDLSVLVKNLLVEGTDDLVGLAGGHVVVVDGIADSDIFLTRNRLVTVGSIDGGGADNGSLHGNGLVNVVDILVVGNLDTVRGNSLEGDELGAGLDAAGIEGEGHGRGTAFGFRRELSSRGDGVAVGIHESLLGGLVHKGSRERVGLPGGKPGVTDIIGNGNITLSGDGLAIVRIAHGACRELRREHGHLLGNVGFVPMLGELRTLCIGKRLIDHEGLPLEVVGIESVVKRDGTCGVLSREGLLGSDSLTVNRDGIAGSGIMQFTDDGVGLTRDEMAVLYLVGNLDGADPNVMVAIRSVVGGGVDFRLRVIEGAEVDGLGITGHSNSCVDERIALISGAAKLFDGIGVKGQGTELVVRLDGIGGGSGAVPIEHAVVAEPETGVSIELRAVDGVACGQRPIVRVGVRVMRVPRGRGAEIAVLVGHSDMGLAGSEGGHLEGHACKAVGTVVGFLSELDIGTVDLLGNLRGIVGDNTFNGIVFLNLLERHFIRLYVAHWGFSLTYDNGATWKCRSPIKSIPEGIARDKMSNVKATETVGVCTKRPRTHRLHVGVLKVIVALVVKGGVVIDGELGTCKGGGTLREVTGAVIGLLAVEFTEKHTHRVICGIVAD